MFELSSSLDGNNQTSCIENDKAMNFIFMAVSLDEFTRISIGNWFEKICLHCGK
jgi:hypothetical protein